MIILVSGTTRTLREHPDLGVLLVPAARQHPKHVQGRVWGCDNSAYTKFDERLFLRMCDHAREETRWHGCQFVAAPDVVGNFDATLREFAKWQPVLARQYRAPVGLVAQDGLHARQVPWSKIDALFIGGSTQWKISTSASTLAAYAKALGKWVHMGRVNSRRRMSLAITSGVDSIDGGAFSRHGDIYAPRGLEWAKDPRQLTQYSMLGNAVSDTPDTPDTHRKI